MNLRSATAKGLITGSVMIVFSLLIYSFKSSFENALQYIVYGMYIAGIIWALLDYQRQVGGNVTFKMLFAQGFRCFIVITLLMVMFTWIFIKLHPETEVSMAEEMRKDLTSRGNYTTAEINARIAQTRQYSAAMFTSMAIFGYLVIGAMITVVTALFLINTRRTPVNKM